MMKLDLRAALGGVMCAASVFGASSVAFAQPGGGPPQPDGGGAIPPTDPAVDEAGVDLVETSFTVASPGIAIGSGAGGLGYSQVYIDDDWHHSVMGTVSSPAPNQLTVSVMGQAETFRYLAMQWTPFVPSGSTLSYSGGVYTYTMSDGSVAEFSTNEVGDVPLYGTDIAVITSLETPSGERATYHYVDETMGILGPDPNCKFPSCNPFDPANNIMNYHDYNRLQSVTTNRGYQLHFEYGRATASTPAEMLDWLRLDEVTALNNAVDYCAPTSNTCSFSETWPSLAISDPTSTSRAYTDNLSRTTTFYFNGDDRVTGVRYPGSTSNDVTVGYTSGLVSSLTSGGITQTYSASTASGTRTVTVAGPGGVQTHIESDTATGNITAVENDLGERTTLEYNINGLLARVTAPEGNAQETLYDSRGNVTEVRLKDKPSGSLADIVTTATYPSSCSNPVTCNQPTSVTNAAGNTTSFTYNSTHGGLLTATQPAPSGGANQPVTRVTYELRYAYYKDYTGSVVQAATGIYLPRNTYSCRTGATPSCQGTSDEHRTIYNYDTTGSYDNLNQTYLSERGSDNTLYANTSFTYDAVGNLITYDPPGHGTSNRSVFIYDDARQRVGVIGPDPDAGGSLTHTAQRTTYNDWGQPTEVEFGTVSSYTNWAGFSLIDRQTVTYDSAGRMTQARLIEGSTTHALMQYSYDSAGRVDCVAQRMNSDTFGSPPASACSLGTTGTLGPDRITRTTYDELNRRADVTTAYGTSDAITEAEWTYTDNGQVETLTDGEGNMYTYVYDAFDRLYRRRYPSETTAGVSATDDYEQFTYDEYGRLATRVTRSGGTFSYDYDNLNRVTDVTAPGSTASTAYTYDNHGRILTVSDGTDTVTNTYNARGWLASQTSANGTVVYNYNSLGQRTRMDWPDSYYVTYTYTQGGQLASIRENGASSGVGRLADFTYDQHGRRILLERGNGVDTDYAYDAASRLEELVQDLNGTSHDRTLEFSYNPAGQITSRTDSNTGYAWTEFVNFTEDSTHNGLNQILSITGQSATPDYDDRGNLIRDHHNQTYDYDEYNRLTEIGSTIELAYDPFGRLAQTSGTGVTLREFMYDGINLIAEYDGSGVIQKRYVHGPGTDEPLVEYTGSGTSSRLWLIADERGSIVALTSAAGNAQAINEYDEYGVPQSGNTGRFGYTGQMWLPETGLYHYKARAYNPELGRFMQTDPIGVNGGMNIYAYVGGDPVNFTDPSGLMTCKVRIADPRRGDGGRWISLPCSNPFGVSVTPDVAKGMFSYTGHQPAQGGGGGSSENEETCETNPSRATRREVSRQRLAFTNQYGRGDTVAWGAVDHDLYRIDVRIDGLDLVRMPGAMDVIADRIDPWGGADRTNTRSTRAYVRVTDENLGVSIQSYSHGEMVRFGSRSFDVTPGQIFIVEVIAFGKSDDSATVIMTGSSDMGPC